MDLIKYEQTLLNIRDKYRNAKTAFTPLGKPNYASVDSRNKDHFIYQTPIKNNKNAGGSNQINESAFDEGKLAKQKDRLFEEQYKSSLTERYPAKKRNQQQFQILTKKNKDNHFEQVVSQREKQLTERMHQNTKLLSKSKEIRQSESKQPTQKSIPSKSNDFLNLKLLLSNKDKGINVTFSKEDKKPINQPKIEKAQDIPLKTHQPTRANNQGYYGSKKANFSERLSKILKQSINNTPSKVYAKQKENQPKFTRITSQKSKIENIQHYSIKTPIAPPKDTSPHKITSVFENTNKIHERILALLSN